MALRTPTSFQGGECFRTDHLKINLGTRAARGGAVAIASQGLRFFITISATSVMARVLTPQDYGLVGMVAFLTAFGSMHKDLGLSAATIQRSEITSEQILLGLAAHNSKGLEKDRIIISRDPVQAPPLLSLHRSSGESDRLHGKHCFASAAYLWYLYYLIGYSVCLTRLFAAEREMTNSKTVASV